MLSNAVAMLPYPVSTTIAVDASMALSSPTRQEEPEPESGALRFRREERLVRPGRFLGRHAAAAIRDLGPEHGMLLDSEGDPLAGGTMHRRPFRDERPRAP